MLSKVIAQANIDHVEKWFDKADKLVIVSHVSPDGDAIGSSLGLYHFLVSQGKTVHVIVPNAFPDNLKWMPGAKDVIQYNRYKDFADKLIQEADVICVLDLNALSRLDDMQEMFMINKVVNRKVNVTEFYGGGMYGYSRDVYDSNVDNTTVTTVNESSYAAGGMFGYRNAHTVKSCGVTNVTVTGNGTEHGGLIGRMNGGTVYSSYVQDSTIYI